MNILNEMDSPSLRLKQRHIADSQRMIRHIMDQLKNLGPLEEELYVLKEEALHIHQIYRLAMRHFPRLKGTESLTQDDINELEKWIKRAKNSNGLKDIVTALNELEKYSRINIRKNLFALVQKIIIEGPYKKKEE
jgi:hypothetical protein